MESLTELDQQCIREGWEVAFGNAEENGRHIFARFFAACPSGLQFFKASLAQGELMESAEAGFHGRRLMVALNQLVESLGDGAAAGRLLGRLAERHKGAHKVPPGMFEAALGHLQALLGRAFTASARDSWGRFFEALQGEIEAAYSRQPQAPLP